MYAKTLNGALLFSILELVFFCIWHYGFFFILLRLTNFET